MGIQVLVRVRPLKAQEVGGSLNVSDGRRIAFGTDGRQSEYEFDKIFHEKSSQEDTFKEVKHVVLSVLEGYSGTIMAYGQTAAGKTHTLFGDITSEQGGRGIVPRSAAEIFAAIAGHPGGCTFKVALSVLEVHNERVRDLLAPSQDNLQVFRDVQGVQVPGMHAELVESEEQCLKLVDTALTNRSVAATAMNEASSRSHCMVILAVKKIFPDKRTQSSKLSLVDLAGSERQSKTGALGLTLQEGQNINKSLLVLGSVVNALSEGGQSPPGQEHKKRGGNTPGQGHVPYRDSKLTRLLQDCLGGTSNTCIMCCVSPALVNKSETVSTLRFGARARAIPCKVSANPISLGAATPEAGEKLAASQKEVEDLRGRLEAVAAAGRDTLGGAAGGSSKRGMVVWVVAWLVQAAGVLLYFALDHYCVYV